MDRVLLSVDPGVINAGYAILQAASSSCELKDIGTLKQSSTKPLAQRVATFYDFFKSKIDQFQVTDIALETPFLGKNAQTFLKLGYLRGILNLLAVKQKCAMVELAPRAIKCAITGYGHATKEQVATALFMLFPQLESKRASLTLDATDALALGLATVMGEKQRLSAL